MTDCKPCEVKQLPTNNKTEDELCFCPSYDQFGRLIDSPIESSDGGRVCAVDSASNCALEYYTTQRTVKVINGHHYCPPKDDIYNSVDIEKISKMLCSPC